MTRRGLPVLGEILLPMLAVLLLATLALGGMYYAHNQSFITKTISDSISQGARDAAEDFEAHYASPIIATFDFLQASQPLDDFLSSEKVEIPLRRAAVERLFLHFLGRDPDILSIRFVDFSGDEKVVVSDGRRITRYRCLRRPAADAFAVHAAALLGRLQPLPPGAVLFEGPFRDAAGRMTFLAGMSKNDPEAGGFGGAVISHWDLSGFLGRLARVRILGIPAAAAVSTRGGLPPGAPPSAPDLFSSSVACRLGTDRATLLTIRYSVPAPAVSAQLRPLLSRTLTIFIVLLGISTCAAFTIARGISRPIVDLTRTVAAIGTGDLSARAQSVAAREIGVLVEGFNAMVERLQTTTVSRDSLAREVAERRKAEEALRQSEERFRRISTIASDIAYSYRRGEDGLCSIDWMMGAADRITGYSDDEIMNLGCWRHLVVPEDRAYFEEEVMSLAPGAQGACEFRIRHKDGVVVWVASLAECIAEPGTAGRAVVFGSLADITQRKRMERALAQERASLVQAEEIAHVGSWRRALKTGALVWSDEMYNIFGLDRGTVGPDMDRAIARVIHPEDRAKVEGAESAVLRDPFPAPIDYRILRPNGNVRWVHAQGRPEVDENGEAVAITGFAQDITERKRNEQELQERNDELTRFACAVSHDLKSPLVTVRTFLGYLEVDMGRQDAAAVAKDLGFIRAAAGKMGGLLDELLDLARVGRKMNPSAEASLNEVAREALRLAGGRLAARHVEVVLSPARVILFGDQARLVEVFLNLVDNAAKFMGEQPRPRVEIGVETRGSQTVFFVRDNGMGVDPRHKDKLFGLFEKLDPGTEGSGMGLTLARRIVEVHGGRMWMESDGMGKGATFLFTLANTRRPAPEAAS